MLALGIDPDTMDTAFAWWDDNGPVAATVAHVIRRKGQDRSLMHTAHAIKHSTSRQGVTIVAVEGQQIDSRTKRKADILKLAQVAGLCVAYVADRYPAARLLVPTPTEWKGGVAKHAHQGRLYKDLGWDFEFAGSGTGRYARPTNPPKTFDNIKAGQWKHVGDALLLARWAYHHAS
jgi:hypothetical protein